MRLWVVWGVFALAIVVAGATEADLPDFDFDQKEEATGGTGDGDADEYYYVNDDVDDQQMQPSHKIPNYNRSSSLEDTNGASKGPAGSSSFLMEDDDTSFDMMDEVDFVEDAEAASNFERKQAAMRRIMLRAFANRDMQRKFGEVLPLLKVMSRAQKATLAALISAQVNSKEGHTMSLEQVKQMFGDRQELILPLVYDIANMIRTVAKKESLLNNQFPAADEEEQVPSQQLLRRSFSVRSEPQGFRMSTEVESADSNLKDDRLVVDVDDEADVEPAGPEGRSLTPVAEKLVQSKPRFNNAQMVKSRDKTEDRMSYHERKLNMTAFNSTKNQRDQMAMPSDGPIPITLLKHTPYQKYSTPTTTVEPEPEVTTLTLEEIEDMALAGLNGTELDALQASVASGNGNGTGPVAEMLIGGYKNRPPGYHKIHMLLPNEKCDHFSTGVCIRVENYPSSRIMNSITRHKSAMGALLAEYIDKSNEFDKNAFEPEEIDGDINTKLRKRSDDPSKTGGGMCPSIIRYARPQKARSATGEWKYIVNTGEHTQTLRLEKCTTPQDSCTYLTDNFRSRCVQIYNYHRLLSWDTARGLHVDIFKVPTCCSCHIDGYREVFPPFNGHNDYEGKSDASYEDPTISASNTHVRHTQYSTLKFDHQHDGPENVDENIAYQYSNGFQRLKPQQKFQENTHLIPPNGPPQAHLPKNRFERPKFGLPKKTNLPNYMTSPVLDSYLSPPPNDVSFHVPFKRGPHFTNDNSLKRTAQVQPSPNRQNRLPIRKQINVDQNIAETDIRINQVQVMPPPKQDRLPPTQATEKLRKRYTTPPTTTSTNNNNKKEKIPNYRIPQLHQQQSSSATGTVKTPPFLPPISSTVTSTTPAASTNGHQRINYNYHPIIDFFGEPEVIPDLDPSEPIDRIGTSLINSGSHSSTSLNSWKPVLHHQQSQQQQRPMRIPV
ncbi:hypothetical protein pipiens_005100 [Culex pipiens pipiens]|uniref:Spaetzle domain-containing protein n=1 Tax=Culex pipiens pipiens TaxID=38569 RepID=A0ABD1CBJ2_CULPP